MTGSSARPPEALDRAHPGPGPGLPAPTRARLAASLVASGCPRGLCCWSVSAARARARSRRVFLRLVPGAYPPHPEVRVDESLPGVESLFVFSFDSSPSPDLLFAELGDVLGLEGESHAYEAIRARLRRLRGLVVLDGLEKVQRLADTGSGTFTDRRVSSLARRTCRTVPWSELKIVATSRARMTELEARRALYFRTIRVGELPQRSSVSLLRAEGRGGFRRGPDRPRRSARQPRVAARPARGEMSRSGQRAPSVEQRLSRGDRSRTSHASCRTNVRHSRGQALRAAAAATCLAVRGKRGPGVSHPATGEREGRGPTSRLRRRGRLEGRVRPTRGRGSVRGDGRRLGRLVRSGRSRNPRAVASTLDDVERAALHATLTSILRDRAMQSRWDPYVLSPDEPG